MFASDAGRASNPFASVKGAAALYEPVVRGVIEQAKGVLVQSNPMLAKPLNEVAAKLNADYANRGEEILDHMARLYAELAQVAPSPVVELNRAVAVVMAFGPQAGLDLVDALTSEPSLREYHLLPTVRGDFLFKLGRFDEARAEFERAAGLTRNARERELLLERARLCGGDSTPVESG